MTILSEEQIAELNAVANGSSLGGRYQDTSRPIANAYNYLRGLLGGEAPSAGADPAVWNWLKGAEDVNRGVGPFSDFIRSYTAEQLRVRYGTNATVDMLNAASDDIGRKVIADIVSNGGVVPNLHRIGEADASGTLGALNTDNPAVWSGNPLFVMLGDPSFLQANILELPTDTYDLLAMLRAGMTALPNVTGSPGAVFTQIIDLLQIGFFDLAGTGVGAAVQINEFFANAYGTQALSTLLELSDRGIAMGQEARSEAISVADDVAIVHGGGNDDSILVRGQTSIIDGGEGRDTVRFESKDGLRMRIEDRESAVAYAGEVSEKLLDIGPIGDILTRRAALYAVEKVQLSAKDDVVTVTSLKNIVKGVEIDAGAGEDEADFAQMDASVTFRAGQDAKVITASNDGNLEIGGIEVYTGSAFADVLSISDDTDFGALASVRFDLGSAGRSPGFGDTISAADSTRAVTINLRDAEAQSVSAGGGAIRVQHATVAVGGAGDDRLTGGSSSTYLEGRGGSDTLVGGASSDILIGGYKNGSAYADDGEVDRITSGGGADRIYIGANDRIVDRLGAGSSVTVIKDGAARFSLLAADLPADGTPGGSGYVLTGGEREKPPEDPCAPQNQPDEDEDGSYEASDGTLYTYSDGQLNVDYGGGTVYVDAFRNGDAGIRLRETRPDQQQAECQRDPLIIDLNGDRDVVTELFDSTAYFDLDNDGFRERVAWVGKDDGLLVMDRNGNGTIDDGTELFGTGRVSGNNVSSGLDGFDELAKMDSNGDFQITNADTGFGALRIWVDANADGITDTGELKTLAELGIVSISLRSTAANSLDCGCDGTRVTEMASIGFGDGRAGKIYDAYLSLDQYDTIETAPATVSEAAAALPFLLGSGTLSDLDVAMSRDPALLEMVQTLADLPLARAGEALGLIEAIVLRWTGADAVAVDSRGSNINARWLAAIEQVSGSEFNQASIGHNPRADAALILTNEWHELLGSVGARLLGQTALGQSMLPGLSFEAGAFFVAADGTTLASALAAAAAAAPTALADALPYWHFVLTTLGVYADTLGTDEGSILAAAQPYLSAAGMPLDATQLLNADFAGAASGVMTGRTAQNNVGSGDDLLVVGAGVTEVLGGGNTNQILLTRGSDTVEVRGGSGTDTLWLVDRSSADVRFGVESNSGGIVQLVLRDAGNDREIARFALEILESGPRTAVEMLRFDDGSVATLDVLSTLEISNGAGGRLIFTGADGGEMLGSSGNDTFIGAGGADTYHFGPGSGSDTVLDTKNFGAIDRVIVAASQADVAITATGARGANLQLSLSTGEQLVVSGQFSSRANTIEEFVFADGSVLTAAQLAARINTGTEGANTLQGTYADDVIDGRGGDDVVGGGAGDDTFLFGPGSGHDRVNDSQGINTVLFAAGVGRDDIDVRVVGTDVVVALHGGNDSLTVSLGTALQSWAFDNGSILLFSELLDLLPAGDREILRGTDENDYLGGSDLPEAIDGGLGDDYLYGGRGADRYILSGGEDTIGEAGTDIDELYIGAAYNWRDVRLYSSHQLTVSVRGTDVMTHANAYNMGPSVRLDGFLDVITFADGRRIDLATGAQRVGTAGDDLLFDVGPRGGTYTPGAGDDLMLGGSGSSTYLFAAGFGNDVIFDSNGYDVVQFDASLAGQAITWTRLNDDLIVTFAGGDRLTMEQVFRPDIYETAYNANRIEAFDLPDGTQIDLADVAQFASVATSGDDVMFGEDVLDGGAGNDLLIGDGSSNTYVFTTGSGNDRIAERNDNYFSESRDVLRLPDLSPEDVTFSRDANDPYSIVVTIKSTGETVTIEGRPFARYEGYDRGETHLEAIEFGDGTTITGAELIKAVYAREATDGADTLLALDRATALDAGAGNDTLLIGERGGTIAWGTTSGNDIVLGGAFDLVLTDILAADLKIRLVNEWNGQSGNHLILVSPTGNTLTIPFGAQGDSFNNPSLSVAAAIETPTDTQRLQQITFADGSSIYYNNQIGSLDPNTIGTDGVDYLSGGSDFYGAGGDHFSGGASFYGDSYGFDELFTPGAGDDFIFGNGGHDRVQFGYGDGVDTIMPDLMPAWKTQTSYTIEMLPGVRAEDVLVQWSAEVFGQLEVILESTGERVLIDAEQLDAITFDDGHVTTLRPIEDIYEYVSYGRPERIGLGNDTVRTYDGGVIMPLTIGRGEDRFIDDGYQGILNGSNDSVYWTPNTLEIAAASADDVIFASDPNNPDDLVVILRETGDRVTIDGQFSGAGRTDVPAAPVTAFAFGDGSVLTWGEVTTLIEDIDPAEIPRTPADVTYLSPADLSPEATDGADRLFLSGGALDSLGGNDLVTSLGGGTFLWSRGDGNDTLGARPYDPTGQGDFWRDEVVFEELVRGDLQFTRDGDDLLVTIVDTGETLRLGGQYRIYEDGGTAEQVGSFVFADGERLVWANVAAIVSNPADTVSTGAGGGTLDGGAGNDLLAGGIGDDDYIFARGYDEDRIRDTGGDDVLRMGDNVTPDQVFFSRTGPGGRDLLVELTGTERLAITVEGQFGVDGAGRIERIEFVDGTVYGWRDVQRIMLEQAATSQADVISGFATPDAILGLAGNDLISGLGGDDRIDGGLGRDTAVLQGARSQYEITRNGSVVTVRDLVANRDGTDVLTDVESLRFQDDPQASADLDLVAPNTAPVVATLAMSGTEDVELAIPIADLLARASDADGDGLSLAGVVEAIGGTAWIGLGGLLRFRPDPDYNGAASVTYRVTDSNGGVGVGRIDIAIAAVNDAPTITGALVTGRQGETLSGTLIGADVDGDTLRYEIVDNGAHGAATVDAATGAFRYLGQPDFYGNDVFTVRVFDPSGASAIAEVRVTLAERPNTAPIAVAATAAAVEDGAIVAGQLLGSDADGDTLSFALVAPVAGLTLAADGAWNFDPSGTAYQPLGGGVSQVITAEYEIADGRGKMARSTLTLTVTGTNDLPTAAVDPASTRTIAEDAGPAEVARITATDVDGDALSFALTSGASDLFAIGSDGVVRTTRVATQADVGAHALIVAVGDGQGVVQVTLDIAVADIRHAPVLRLAEAGPFFVAENAVAGAVAQVLATDADGDPVSFTLLDGGDLFAIGADGTVRTTRAADDPDVGPRQLTVVADDGQGGSQRLTFDVAVLNLNDAPIIAHPIADVTWRSGTAQSYVLAADAFTDADRDVLSYTATQADGSALPSWLRFDAAARTFSGTAPTAGGSLDVRVSASDGVASASDVFTLTAPTTGGGGSTSGFVLVGVNSWYNPAYGGGAIVEYRYTVQADAIVDGSLKAIEILADYDGPGRIIGGWVNGFNGPLQITAIDNGHGLQITNVGAGYKPDLQVGQTFTLSVQLQDASFTSGDLDFTIFDRDPPLNRADAWDASIFGSLAHGTGGRITDQLRVHNTSGVAIDNWSAILNLPDGVRLDLGNVWGAKATQLTNGDVRFDALDWNRSIAASGDAQFGFDVGYTGANQLEIRSTDFHFV